MSFWTKISHTLRSTGETRLHLCWCGKLRRCFWAGNHLLWTTLHHIMPFRWWRAPVSFPAPVLEPGMVQLKGTQAGLSHLWCETQEERNGLKPPFHAPSPCSLILLWAKDMKGEEKKMSHCLRFMKSKQELFNSDYSAIVYFCFCVYYTAYKVCKILTCFFLLDIAKEDPGKSQWINMQLPWPIASAEMSATHAAVVECLSHFTFNP